jgi:hypothetical protein
MTQAANARTAPSHHLDHLELLMLDSAVARLTETYCATRALTALQREVLAEYGNDVRNFIADHEGPAREFAQQLAALVRTVLAASAQHRKFATAAA